MILGKIQINPHYSLNNHLNTLLIFIGSLLAFCFFYAPAFAGCPSISDDPMETKVQSAPPNIMFVLDNSGSMDWEFMTPESDGKFDGEYYLYPDSAYLNHHDRIYNSDTILSESGRKKWKSQWYGYNKIFYNPSAAYTPWPTLNDASPTEPFANPSKSDANDSKFDPGGIFYTIENFGSVEAIVDNQDSGFEINNPGSGAWSLNSSAYSSDRYGSDYCVSTDSNNSADDWVRWTPNLPRAGVYKVAVNWTSTDDRDESTRYTISHDGKTDISAPQDLQKNAGQWNQIGEYEFKGDGNEYVQLNPDQFGRCCYYSADAVKFYIPGETVDISNAHYFTAYKEIVELDEELDEEKIVKKPIEEDEELDGSETVYLVNFVDTDNNNILDARQYYLFNDLNGNDAVDDGELILKTGSEIPEVIKVSVYKEDGTFDRFATVDEELQNFANWFSYYRKRALTAKAAVARSIYNLEGVYAGFYSINSGLRQTVLPIEADIDLITDTIIVDNKDSGYDDSSQNWRESGASNEYKKSSRYTSHSGDYATWTANIPSDGSYKVYVWYDYSSNRDTNALYTVFHADGEKDYRKNQKQNSSQWVLLGQHEFKKGNSGYVRVKRDGSSTGSSTSADAVKFELSTNVNTDETQTLLDLLYSMDSSGGTPLRTALKNVGRYFHQDDGNDGGLGDSPYHDADDGGACQQAFSIVMTDGFWNGDNPSVGNQDADSAGSSFDGSPYADAYSNTLADVAMKYYKEDLSSTLDNIVPTNSCDGADHQHMVTYGISFGVTGSLNSSDYHSCLLDGGTPPWPNPDSTTYPEYKIDDLWHASVNGRGLFFSASNPQELVSSLVDMMSNIESRISSGASVSVNGEELNASTVLYQASYKSSSWTGDVTAYPIDPSTGEIQRENSNIKWKASDKLQDISFNDRKILSFSSASMDGITFRYDSLTDDQKSKLNNDSNFVDYIRGKEISGFRSRTKKLGDIVHSAPLLMGETIYAGGNDGMLHAFDAGTGVERFAYVPELVLDNFYNETTPEKSFTAPGYEHIFFVDRSPVARKGVMMGKDYDGNGTNDSTTLLVGGLGKGGKGYFGIDITDADSIVSDTVPATLEEDLTEMVLWEYPTTTDNDLGYTYSTPVIVKCNADLDGDNLLNDWVVIFGNGYDSVNGDAALYILKVDGTLVKKINTKQSSCNGLSSPSVIDTNNDGRADYAYAGDLKGNLWKFDLTGSAPDDWDVAYGSAETPQPLIKIPGQPITSKPDVMRHCETGVELEETCGGNNLLTGYMVIFGTGKYLDEADRTSSDTQTIFGIWDYGDGDDEYLGEFDRDADPTDKQLSNQSEDVTLLEQTEVDSRILNGAYLRTLSENVPEWTAECDKDEGENPNPVANAGWYFDLPTSGERIIKDVMIRDGKVIYLTFTPNTSPCSGGGDSMIHEADACSGGRLSPAAFDINGDREIDQDDLIDIGLKDEEGNPILVAPTGLKRPGLLHFPVILRMPDDKRELKIFSSSAGTTETLFETAEKRGLYYWIER